MNCRTIAVDSLTDLPEQKIKQVCYILLETEDKEALSKLSEDDNPILLLLKF